MSAHIIQFSPLTLKLWGLLQVPTGGFVHLCVSSELRPSQTWSRYWLLNSVVARLWSQMDQCHLAELPRAIWDLRQSTAVSELSYLLWAMRTVMPTRWGPAGTPSLDPCLASRHWNTQCVLCNDWWQSSWCLDHAGLKVGNDWSSLIIMRKLWRNRGSCDVTERALDLVWGWNVSSVCCEGLGWGSNPLSLSPSNIRNMINNNSLGGGCEYWMTIVIIYRVITMCLIFFTSYCM